MKVKLTIDNYTKCLCPVCPVQEKSKCIALKKANWQETRKKVGRVLEEYPFHPETYEIEMDELEKHEIGKKHGFFKPNQKDMIELFCSKAVGKSDCSDLDSRQKCNCPDCAVWSKSGLKTAYYCMRGSSEEIE